MTSRPMMAYYNEFDKKKCAMLSQLMKDGLIMKGDIDDRSIADVRAADLKGYARCHFFAGVGLWEHALQLAGWEEDRPVWTGSCPCQPFSSAGRQKGKADDRHLWPEWLRLIRECRPATIFGEQVHSAVAHGWLDDVYQGLEIEGYAVGAAVLPACGVGAPHRRDRLWFVANSESERIYRTGGTGCEKIGRQERDDCLLTYGASEEFLPESPLGDASSPGLQGHGGTREESCAKRREIKERHHWEAGVWLSTPDGTSRLVEPSIPLLVNGDTERVGLIHASGDAIVPQVAATWIRAYREALR